MSKSSIKVPPVPSRVNWRPRDYEHALNVYDRGGPLVDPSTGRVILLAQMSDGLWTQLVALPEGASPTVVPLHPPAPPAARVQAARAAWKAASQVMAHA
jgi:hypothetical protein